MYKVLVTDHVYNNLDLMHEVLDPLGVDIIERHFHDSSELISEGLDAKAILTTYMTNITGEVMDKMPSLSGIVRSGIGVDTIDLAAAKSRGIKVANVPDYCLDEVSDHACAITLSLVRKVTLSSNRIKSGDYGLGYVHPVKNLRKSVVTVLGYGRIGRKIAGKLSGFGCRLQFFDPFVQKDEVAQKVDFDEALSNSDILILQAPSTPQTHHMLNSEAFAKMTKKPFVINTARGDLIDTSALIKALDEGIISGAGLDVVDGFNEISADHILCKYENVILTPHSAWVSEDAFASLQQLASEEVRRILLDEPVRSNVIR